MAGNRPPRRVRVAGDYFHGRVPDGAVYVGRSAPGLRGSRYANVFPVRRGMSRGHPLRPYLDAAIINVDGVTAARLAARDCDVLRPGTARIASTAFYYWFRDQPALIAEAEAELAGRDLACWCPEPAIGEPDWCHAFTLLLRVNGPNVAVPSQRAFAAGEW
jgi:uncharacterized protein DUF4326